MGDVVPRSGDPVTEPTGHPAPAADGEVGRVAVDFIYIGPKECAEALTEFPAEATTLSDPDSRGTVPVETEGLDRFLSEPELPQVCGGRVAERDTTAVPRTMLDRSRSTTTMAGDPARNAAQPRPLISRTAIALQRIPMLAVVSIIGLVLITAGLAVRTFVFSPSPDQTTSARLEDTGTPFASDGRGISTPHLESTASPETTGVTAPEPRSEPHQPPQSSLASSKPAAPSVPKRLAPETPRQSPLTTRVPAVPAPLPAAPTEVTSLAGNRPAVPTPAPIGTVARPPDLRGEDPAPRVVPPAVAPRIVPDPVPAAAVPPGLPSSVAPAITPRGAIQRTLDQYQSAFSRLDEEAVRDVWPTADRKALARAFGQLEEETLRFDACDVTVSGQRATASCGGTLQYVPRVGGKTPRVERRRWRLSLREAANGWVVDSVDVGQ